MSIEDQLKRLILFRNFTEEQLGRVCRSASTSQLEKGGRLFEQGDAANCFFYLLEGQIKLSRISIEGDEKIIEVISPGGVFAEALMFLEATNYPVTAEALSNSRLIRVHFQDYRNVLRESVDVCFGMFADLSKRIHGLVMEIDHLTLQNAACRVAGYLMTHAPEDTNEYDLETSKHVLASRLSIKPETLSRIIKQLCTMELIQLKGNHVTILDPDKLREFSDSCALEEGSLSDSFHHSGD
mgnify:CR=1 FL=1